MTVFHVQTAQFPQRNTFAVMADNALGAVLVFEHSSWSSLVQVGALTDGALLCEYGGKDCEHTIAVRAFINGEQPRLPEVAL